MTEIHIWISILIVAWIGVGIYALIVRRRNKNNPELKPREVTPIYTRGYGYSSGINIVESNVGFTEGIIIGSMLNDRPVSQTVVNETVVVEDSTQYTAAQDTGTFIGFSGGDSGGGGASSSWDSSSDDGSSNSGSSDSSSFDSSSDSSSDSGGSGDY